MSWDSDQASKSPSSQAGSNLESARVKRRSRSELIECLAGLESRSPHLCPLKRGAWGCDMGAYWPCCRACSIPFSTRIALEERVDDTACCVGKWGVQVRPAMCEDRREVNRCVFIELHL